MSEPTLVQVVCDGPRCLQKITVTQAEFEAAHTTHTAQFFCSIPCQEDWEDDTGNLFGMGFCEEAEAWDGRLTD